MNITLVLLTILVSVLSGNPLWANSYSNKNELIVHIITPKHRTNWESPRLLGLSTGLNSIGDDYAPIGHFAIELKCDTPNKYGTKHILTGMERLNKKESSKITLQKKLGLGSLFYNFVGNLQSAEQSREEIEMARKDKRLTTVSIPTSSSRCQMAMTFLDNWIEAGAYTVYGGNKDVLAGEGSGCADFALEFFRIATSVVPRKDIMVRIKVPNRLIGDGLKKEVPFTKILAANRWAEDLSDAREYATPDTNKVIDFLHKDTMAIEKNYVYVLHLGLEIDDVLVTAGRLQEMNEKIELKASELAPYEITQYDFKYKYPQRESSLESWSKIIVAE